MISKNSEYLNILAASLKELRDNKEISQKDLADVLEITQASVSRLEAGKQKISVELEKKIIEILKFNKVNFEKLLELKHSEEKLEEKKQKEEVKAVEAHGYIGKKLSHSSVKFEINGEGGDFISFNEIEKNSITAFVLGDTVGHGKESSSMAFAMEMAFESVTSLLNPRFLTAHFIDQALSYGVYKTSRRWKGEPSIVSGIIDIEKNRIEFINRGMPYPIVKSGSNCELLNALRYRAIDLSREDIDAKESSSFDFNEGDSVIFYSDGLSDFLGEDRLLRIYKRFSQMFRGDARAISKNLQREIMQTMKKNEIGDDMSFMIISRRAK